MRKKDFEELLTIMTSTGADFGEIYLETAYSNYYNVLDSKLDSINTDNWQGVGMRIIKDGEYYYSSTNIITPSNLKKTAQKLALNLDGKSNNVIKLRKLKKVKQNIKIKHTEFSSDKKKTILLDLDKLIREKYKQITQVALKFVEDGKMFTIANSTGKYITSDSYSTRFICYPYAEQNGKKETAFFGYGQRKGYEVLDEIDLQKECLETAEEAISKLSAVEFKGGKLPVIIGNGIGALIFHEACGHGLEATQIAPNRSVFCNELGKTIASPKVTLIDDGTIENSWGGFLVDDEGNLPQKNILIENGVLKKYLVDDIHAQQLKINSNGCARRQSYLYPPTSRMSNTYLAPGTDTFEEMISNIKLGVYCKRLSGGQVNAETGDFNFAVSNAILIENGHLTTQIKGITLIGNSKEILKKVDMVGSDFVLADGYCGSKSGNILVGMGQPTIKVSEILVGGRQ